MISGYQFQHLNEVLTLLPQGAIYWKKMQALLLSDLHLGKSSHFRKEGIPVPKELKDLELDRLEKLLSLFPVKSVYLLGDLFHSVHNPEWDEFVFWMARHRKVAFYLVKGNHDILPGEFYQQAAFAGVDKVMQLGPFTLIHDPADALDEQRYYLAGHVHPSILLKGGNRSGSLRLNCFFFTEKVGILPAFGRFTGSAVLRKTKKDKVFAIVEDKVVRIP